MDNEPNREETQIPTGGPDVVTLPANVDPAINYPIVRSPDPVDVPGPGEEPYYPKFQRRLSGMFTVDARRLASINLPAKAVTVGASSTKILDKNDSRIFATIVNDSANTVYITLGDTPAVSATGIRLNANGGSLVFGLGTDIPYTGQVNGIASGASNVVVTES